MGFFTHKTEVTIDGYCRQFYDSVVFQSTVGGLDFNEVWWKTIFNSVIQADESFSIIDKNLFIREMTALRLELFAIAWGYKFKHEKFTVQQSVFTFQYLEEHGKHEVWDTMGEYNKVIAQTGLTGKPNIANANLARSNMFDKYCLTLGVDPSTATEEQKRILNSVARTANRIGADIRRNDSILIKRLTARLAMRLSCDSNLSN